MQTTLALRNLEERGITTQVTEIQPPKKGQDLHWHPTINCNNFRSLKGRGKIVQNLVRQTEKAAQKMSKQFGPTVASGRKTTEPRAEWNPTNSIHYANWFAYMLEVFLIISNALGWNVISLKTNVWQQTSNNKMLANVSRLKSKFIDFYWQMTGKMWVVTFLNKVLQKWHLKTSQHWTMAYLISPQITSPLVLAQQHP